MKKALKKIKTTQLILLAGVSSLLLLISACSSTQILQDNGDIPAPSLNPPDNANQLASPSQVEESLSSSTETVQLSSPVTQTAPVSLVKYTVKKGDSLWKVAKMFDVSVNELAAYNNIDPKSSVKVGQSLQIPPAGLAVPRAISSVPSSDKTVNSTAKTASDKSPASVSGAAYTVKSGDSLWTIAKKNHISTKKLAEANGLDEKASLKIGQKLIIPGSKSSTVVADKKIAKNESAASAAPVKQALNQTNDLINQTSQEATSGTKVSSAQAVQIPSTPAVAQSVPVTSAVASTAAAAPAPTSNYLPHTVKDGDTWQTISDMYGVSIEDLKKVNPSIAGDTQPKSGTVVNIPEE
ncbi:MAG: LysM peptidoglycan-binding domain-containing protein [Lentisphaerota bacterium]